MKEVNSAVAKQSEFRAITDGFISVNDRAQDVIAQIKSKLDKVHIILEPKKQTEDGPSSPLPDTFVATICNEISRANKNYEDLLIINRHLDSLV